jgi:hypothetical protein
VRSVRVKLELEAAWAGQDKPVVLACKEECNLNV